GQFVRLAIEVDLRALVAGHGRMTPCGRSTGEGKLAAVLTGEFPEALFGFLKADAAKIADRPERASPPDLRPVAQETRRLREENTVRSNLSPVTLNEKLANGRDRPGADLSLLDQRGDLPCFLRI